MTYKYIIDYAWTAVGIIWVVSALGTKRSVRRECGSYRVVQIIFLIVGILLLFDPYFFPQFLAWRIMPATPVDWIIGIVITFAGQLFALWARFFLGRNWSASITVKQDHQLIRTGPYAIVRHPIYSGFLLGLLGTAIAFGRSRDFLGLILATLAGRFKSLVEERLMREEFGAAYTTYQREVKALVPFIW